MEDSDQPERDCSIVQRFQEDLGDDVERQVFDRLKALVDSHRWYPQSEDGHVDTGRTPLDFCDLVVGFSADEATASGLHITRAGGAGSPETDAGLVMIFNDVRYVGIPVDGDTMM